MVSLPWSTFVKHLSLANIHVTNETRNDCWYLKRAKRESSAFLGGASSGLLKSLLVANIACVASVSMEFPDKFRCFCRAKIGARAKNKEGGGGEEKRKCLQSNPWNLKIPFASERGSCLALLWSLLLTCAHQRSDFARIQHGRRKGRRVPSLWTKR